MDHNKLIWTLQPFDELSIKALYEILSCRSAVFVVEQACAYQDLDNKDLSCFHLIGREQENGPIAAYTRIVPPGVSYEEPSIGRVLTTDGHRGKDYGKQLMEQSISIVQALYPEQKIRIGAQVYLDRFYQSLGFRPVGDSYDEDGIEHIEMLHD